MAKIKLAVCFFSLENVLTPKIRKSILEGTNSKRAGTQPGAHNVDQDGDRWRRENVVWGRGMRFETHDL